MSVILPSKIDLPHLVQISGEDVSFRKIGPNKISVHIDQYVGRRLHLCYLCILVRGIIIFIEDLVSGLQNHGYICNMNDFPKYTEVMPME